MRKTISILFVLALVLSFSLVATTPVAAQPTWYVDASNCPGPGTGTLADPFCTIQAAVTAASPGHTILVAADNYNESVTIDKAITIIGDRGDLNTAGPGPSAPVLDGTGLSNVPGFSISSGVSGVTIEGFEIRNYGPSGSTNANGVTGWGVGIDNVTVRYNHIHSIGYSAVLTGNGWGAAPQAVLDNWTISYNIISSHGAYAIDLENAGNSLISRNQISAGSTPEKLGIVVMALGTSTNTITVSGVTISENQFTNYPDRAIMVLAWAADAGASATLQNLAIVGNTITGNWNAINVWKTGAGVANLRDFQIIGNSIAANNPKGNEYAISLHDVAGTSVMTGNTVTLTGTIGGGGIFFHGVDVAGASTGDWTIADNHFDGNNVGTASVGIRLRSSIPASAKLDINCNTITRWVQGIRADALAAGTTVEAHFNSLVANSVEGILNGAGASIDARHNWWGAASGPIHASNPGGSGDRVSDNVNFTPWLGALPAPAKSVTPVTGGTASFATSAGNILDLTPVAAPSLPSVTFPHGMFSFQICCLTPGQTVDLTVTLPSAVPVGTVWWKYDNGRWYSLPNLNDNGDNIMVIRLTDGGTGDSDGQKDGFITDPGGPGNPMTVGWDGSPVGKAGVLAPWIALLAAVIAGTGLFVWKRRRVEI